MPDPSTQNQNNQTVPAAQSSTPVQTDLPPLPADFQSVMPDSPTTQSISQPADSLTESPTNASQPNIDNGPSAPPDLPPMITTPKKKFGGGKIIATILGILLLVGGVGAGAYLTQQKQLIQEKAVGTHQCQGCGSTRDLVHPIASIGVQRTSATSAVVSWTYNPTNAEFCNEHGNVYIFTGTDQALINNNCELPADQNWGTSSSLPAGCGSIQSAPYGESSSGPITIPADTIYFRVVTKYHRNTTDGPEDALCGGASYPLQTTNPTSTPTPTTTATATPTATPTSTTTATPTTIATATATPTATPTSTTTPITITNLPTATPATPILPQSGTGWPTTMGIGVGILTIIGALLLAI